MLNVNINKLNRWQAFSIHLGISFLIFLFLLGLIVFYWYPGVFLKAGGTEGIKIVAGVDLVLGPLLTLIVFNPLKKSLKLDLLTISIIQISCLIAGLWLVFNERPLVQILVDDQVYLLTAADYKNAGVDIATLEIIDGKPPKKVLLDLPANKADAMKVTKMPELIGLNPIYYRTDLYLPLTDILKTEQKGKISELIPDTKNNCWIVKVVSTHLVNGKGCLNAEQGIIKIEAEE